MKKVAIAVLQVYKRFISPMLPNACRFVPSCSEYAMEAVERHGVVHGGALAAWRVMRCNPLGGHGLDPVPVAERDLTPMQDGRCCPTSK